MPQCYVIIVCKALIFQKVSYAILQVFQVLSRGFACHFWYESTLINMLYIIF